MFLELEKSPTLLVKQERRSRKTKLVQRAVKKSRKVLNGIGKTIVAVGSLKEDISKGKTIDQIGSNLTKIVKAETVEEATKVAFEQKFSYYPKLVQPKSASLVRDVKIADAPLAHLRDVLHIIAVGSSGDSDVNRARKYARYAAHSYGDLEDDVLPEQAELIDKFDTEEGLNISVYREGSDHIVCSFAGTSFWDLDDWKNNFTQLAGVSKQYEEALNFARCLKHEYPNKTIVYVGHSLGGGEAAYCAYNMDGKAEIYNPAGLSPLTKIRCNSSAASISAYVFSTDILNKLQAAVGIEPNGDVHYIPANVLQHGMHGILGILRYFNISYTKRKKRLNK